MAMTFSIYELTSKQSMHFAFDVVSYTNISSNIVIKDKVVTTLKTVKK